MRTTLLIFAFFCVGLVLSWQQLLPEVLLKNDFSTIALYVLMFLVGIGIGADTGALQLIRQLRYKILLIPAGTIVGTFLGMAIVYPMLPMMSFWEAQAVGAGYGYYSLSSILIAEMRTETLGAIALLANVIREIITLLLTPFLAKVAGKFAPIASGGATSMDTTLPVIVQTIGKDYAIISIFHGTVLTILVPFIVTLFLS
ncbi:MAG: lysine exporter LysO family protein [Salinivirgaceae bacterium]|jgi:uncharacterized membrane protein YbjE (DUF340 family)